ncbi:head decoration protein [Polycladidibacter hongkongensis]|uniref:head decoration protein n=1 Tax=Polycladidibacter hongkongensis TaxID=1647556 RepID=UPI000AB8D57F|nr:head decoration protein [Pseudovibrio hongkongensis]
MGVIKMQAPERASALVKYETSQQFCREEYPLAVPAEALGIQVGSIFAVVGGKAQPIDLTENGAAGKFAGFAIQERSVAAGSAGLRITLLSDGPAIVAQSAIKWPEGATEPQKTALKTAMRGRGIKLR